MANNNPEVRIHVLQPVPAETEMVNLICAHCKLPHPVTAAYRQGYVDRLNALNDLKDVKASGKVLTIDDIWMCGCCYAKMLGLPATIKTECQHEVPPFAD